MLEGQSIEDPGKTKSHNHDSPIRTCQNVLLSPFSAAGNVVPKHRESEFDSDPQQGAVPPLGFKGVNHWPSTEPSACPA